MLKVVFLDVGREVVHEHTREHGRQRKYRRAVSDGAEIEAKIMQDVKGVSV